LRGPGESYSGGVKSRDEIRVELGLDPWGVGPDHGQSGRSLRPVEIQD
jgi:hypothetical protein